MAIESSVAKVKNPLTMIAVFATISEVAMAYVLATLPDKLQTIFIWFVMGFPTFLILAFFFILYRKPAVFFSPGDYKKEELYVSSIGLGKHDESLDVRVKKIEAFVVAFDDFLEKTKPGTGGQVEYTEIRKSVLNQQALQENPLYAFITNDLGVGHEVAQRLISASNGIWDLPQFLVKEVDDQRKVARLVDLLKAFPNAEMDFQRLRPLVLNEGGVR